MFRNIFLKTLRDNRGGVLGWGLGLGVLGLIGVVQYPQLFGAPGAARERTAAELVKALQAFSFMTGEVTSVTTLGGFITVRLLGLIPVMLALWALAVGSGLIRGAE